MTDPVRALVAVGVLVAATACSTNAPPIAAPPSRDTRPSVSPPVTTSPSPTAAAATVPWPHLPRPTPPRALGAYRTTRTTRLSGGGTIAGGLVLPRVGGTQDAPVVLTPCGRRVTPERAALSYLSPGDGGPLPKAAAHVVVVVDPGHGGAARGAKGADGSDEADRVLEISREVRSALAGRVARVVLTRDRDMDARQSYRVAVADALNADAAVSVHLNSEPDGPRATPGLETYGSVAGSAGRRFAGVMYASERGYLDGLGGPWVGDRDAGAKYRTGRNGRDYYGLLRQAHVPWVISESMFITAPREAALVAQPAVRRSLGRAIADGLVSFTQTDAAGSGWVTRYPRPPAPPAPGSETCRDLAS
ncbi:MAG: N-acetylmuramoyl-L-alanine amidase [Mycobacteriales bacterium]